MITQHDRDHLEDLQLRDDDRTEDLRQTKTFSIGARQNFAEPRKEKTRGSGATESAGDPLIS